MALIFHGEFMALSGLSWESLESEWRSWHSIQRYLEAFRYLAGRMEWKAKSSGYFYRARGICIFGGRKTFLFDPLSRYGI